MKALSIGGAWAYFSTDLVDQSVRAWLLFSSANCFERVVKRQGHDITNLLVSAFRSCKLALCKRQLQSHPCRMGCQSQQIMLCKEVLFEVGHSHSYKYSYMHAPVSGLASVTQL